MPLDATSAKPRNGRGDCVAVRLAPIESRHSQWQRGVTHYIRLHPQSGV